MSDVECMTVCIETAALPLLFDVMPLPALKVISKFLVKHRITVKIIEAK